MTPVLLIARHFSVGNMKGKSHCKRDLQKLFGLPQDPFAPVIGLGSRMSHQKMADVVIEALPGLLERHARAQVVVLGCGDHEYQRQFLALAARYHSMVSVVSGTTLGMMLANVPAVYLGDRIAGRIPLKLVHGIAALIFAALGVATLLGAGAGLGV